MGEYSEYNISTHFHNSELSSKLSDQCPPSPKRAEKGYCYAVRSESGAASIDDSVLRKVSDAGWSWLAKQLDFRQTSNSIRKLRLNRNAVKLLKLV